MASAPKAAMAATRHMHPSDVRGRWQLLAIDRKMISAQERIVVSIDQQGGGMLALFKRPDGAITFAFVIEDTYVGHDGSGERVFPDADSQRRSDLAETYHLIAIERYDIRRNVLTFRDGRGREVLRLMRIDR